MNSTYGLECQVRYLAEQVDRLTRVLTRVLNDFLPGALKDILTALEKKEEEEE